MRRFALRAAGRLLKLVGHANVAVALPCVVVGGLTYAMGDALCEASLDAEAVAPRTPVR